jgi:hypothetical protein
VDPSSEQSCSEASIKAFQATYADELGSKGLNWRHVFYQRAKEERLLKELGLVSPTAAAGAPVFEAIQAAEQTAPEAGKPETGSGEMMGLSRLQWNRNRKAIMDVLNDFIAKSVTKAQATVLLSGIGLSEANVQMLLADAEDGTVDSVKEEPVNGG